MRNWIFYLGLATLFTHELDAMPNHEWRLLPVLRSLPEEQGMTAFVLLHVPLFALLIGLASSANTTLRTRSRWGISLFLAIHGLLHASFRGHPDYTFTSTLSESLIFGGALLGAVYLVLDWWGRQA